MTEQANIAFAQQRARETITEFSIRSAPVQIERIVKAKGIVLQYSPLDDALSGLAFIKDGIPIIGVNALHHPNRQRFSIAHELAHHILHPEQITSTIHVDKEFKVLYRDELASQGVDPWEIEANAFASELLVPESFLRDLMDASGFDIEDDDKIELLARKFRISPSAMRYRLIRHQI
jgi:Zn-dependent peptidase ImmA (M78 family)